MNNFRSFTYYCYVTALIMIAVLFWDYYALKADITSVHYIAVKSLTIGMNFLLVLYFQKKRKVPLWSQDVYAINAYLYALYGMAMIDMTYSFTFIEVFFLLAVVMKTPTLRFIIVNSMGLLACLVGHYYAKEPIFVASGHSFKGHSFVVTLIFYAVALAIHFYFNRYQTKIHELNEKFALVGKQSSFLMHEIKAPLGRVMVNAAERPSLEIMDDIRRDSQKISALVMSVEALIHTPDRLPRTFTTFEWNEVKRNLFLDFNTYLTSMNITLMFEGFEGGYFGNKHLIAQLLKNMILNAIEAIGFRKDAISEIALRLENTGNKVTLTVSNTNSTIAKRDLGRIFEPHFTTKKNETNKGLGLALVKSIVEAHEGDISVTSLDNRTTFFLSFPLKVESPVIV